MARARESISHQGRDEVGAGLYAVREALARERAEAPLLAALLAAQPAELQRQRLAADPRFRTWGLCERLLELGAAAPAEPREAARLAELALAVAERLVHSIHPAPVVADLTARCWAQVGETRRALGDLPGAADALAAARRGQQAGTGDLLIEAAVMELAAAVDRDQGNGAEADASLRRAAGIYLETRETGRLARLLRSSARLPRRLRAAVSVRARREAAAAAASSRSAEPP